MRLAVSEWCRTQVNVPKAVNKALLMKVDERVEFLLCGMSQWYSSKIVCVNLGGTTYVIVYDIHGNY